MLTLKVLKLGIARTAPLLALVACAQGAIAEDLPPSEVPPPTLESTAAPTAQPSSPSEVPPPTLESTALPTAQPSPPSEALESVPTQIAEVPEIIGRSVAGRPLTMYRFGNGPAARLIVAGIHGGYEWNTIALANQLMSHLSVHPEMIPRGLILYVLPALNPDGQARSHWHAGRANENGVDLNRNWPSQWQQNWPKAGCWNYQPINGGRAPASEPEVAALMEFILTNDVEAIISYHSAALGIFPGGQPPLPDSVELADSLAEVTPYPYPPIDAGCVYTGQFTDWAAGRGIPAVDVELTDHTDTDFKINLRVLEVFLEWTPERCLVGSVQAQSEPHWSAAADGSGGRRLCR